MRFVIIVLMSVLAIHGCHNGKDDLTCQVEYYFNKQSISFTPEQDVVLIIPANGCPGCVADGLKFITKNQQYFSKGQNKNSIIFTGVASKKLLHRKLKGIKIEYLAAKIDTAEIYLVDFDACDYPLVIYLNNGAINKVANITSDSEIYKKLEHELY